ncbi:MAG: adenylyl-sulfate kinase [Nitrospiraceae bacterium]|nr:MAG: adenylyl-sulfate kinase [Nitrospiraceae bacterium]
MSVVTAPRNDRYKKARLGQIAQYTGSPSLYETPTNLEITMNSGTALVRGRL